MHEWEEMHDFIAETHGPNHPMTQIELFSWFFCRRQNKNHANVLIARDNGQLVSLLGYLPTSFLLENEFIDGAWMAHWMTLKSHRHGIGAILMRRMTELYSVVAGQGASNMNKPIAKKLGYSFDDSLKKAVFLFNSEMLKIHFNSDYENSTTPFCPRLDYKTHVKNLTPVNYDPNWSLYSELAFSTLRNRDYLNKRYALFPFHDYTIMVDGPRDRPTLCIFRIVNTNIGLKVGRIVEYLTPTEYVTKSEGCPMIIQCISLMKEEGVAYIDFYTSSKNYLNKFIYSGFVEDACGVLPSLLDPIDPSRKFQNCEVFVETKLKCKLDQKKISLFVSRGDGDQDRPNLNYMNKQNNRQSL